MFFDSSIALLKSEISYHTPCPKCGQKGGIAYSVYGKYVRYFFVPCFPNGRKLFARCEKCHSSWEYNYMSQEMKNEVFAFSQKQRRPAYHYLGIFLFLCFALFLFYVMRTSDSNRADKLANPMIHDRYEIRNEADGYYSYMRIEDMNADSVYFAINKYTTRKSHKLASLDIDENYEVEHLFPVARKELDLKNVEGITLYSIERAGD